MRLRKRERAKQPQRNRVPKLTNPDRSKPQRTSPAERAKRLTKPTRQSRRFLGLPAEFPEGLLTQTPVRQRPRLEVSSYRNPTESWVLQTPFPKQISQSRSIMPPRGNKSRDLPGGRSVRANYESNSRDRTSKSTTKTTRSQASTRTPKDKDWAQTLQEGIMEGNKWLHLYTNDTDLRHIGNTEDFLAKNSENLLNQLKSRRQKHTDPRYMLNSLKAKLRRLNGRPEVNVVHELQDLACPPAEGLADIYVDDDELGKKYRLFVESWGERWSKQIPTLGKSAPRPDYCVGFSRNSFRHDQRVELDRNANATMTFRPTSLMCFPFLTCEAKALEPIDIAESQNCWSMLIAVRATVRLFETANLQDDINREILAFSVGYNNREVEVHAYYPILDGDTTIIYRREIHFSFLSPDRNSQDPWEGADLVRNVYEIWAPKHLDRLHKAIDAIGAMSQETESSSSTVIAEEPPGLPSSASETARRQDQPHETESSSRKRGRADQPSVGPSKRKFNLRSNKTTQEPTRGPTQDATPIPQSTGASFEFRSLNVD